MPRPSHFEIHAAEPERAMQFYGEVFGWTFRRWGNEAYWLVTTGPDDEPGINGGLLPRRSDEPVALQGLNAFPCTIDVPDLASFTDRVIGRGGELVVPAMPILGVGWVAYAKDTEGNIFGMLQTDPTAA